MREKDNIYEIHSDIADLNKDNLLKPYGYQKLIGQIIDWHLDKMDVKLDMTLEYNLAWAFVSLAVEIVKPVEGIIMMYAQTWHSKRRGPFFRREFIFKNESGEILFQGASYSVLLDIEKRSIYRKNELPFDLFEANEDFVIEASPTMKINSVFMKTDERKAYNSYIDRLAHVNNIRYGEFAYDALSVNECNNLRNLNRFDLYFKAEIKHNDIFSILKAYDDKLIIVRGNNETNSNISFDVIFEF